ncbi:MULTISPECIES: ABC transporter permease [Cysteiniphilum]|uniref:ABC transporter permease n=1 Tax=Cysteiniphilum TaxID=2056696 RepID=UPI00177EF550|nr:MULTISPECIES: iron ABC transporter permease [Cysteiniphilum]
MINKVILTIASFIAALILMPVFALLVESITQSNQAIFEHLWQTTLFHYIKNSLLLGLGVVLLSLFFAIPSAWLVTHFEFPLSRYFQWLLVLPLAIPSYVVAYLYTDLFDYSGVVQSTIRWLFDFDHANDYWFFNIRSLGGAIFILALNLYPYLFLLLKTAFSQQSTHLDDAASLLGGSSYRRFVKITLPLAMPVIIAGCALIAMESLSEFATVQYFAINTLTTAIYDTWLGLGSLSAAAKLAMILLLFIIILLSITRYFQKRELAITHAEPRRKIALDRRGKFLAFCFCFSIFFLGFLLPFIELIYYAIKYFAESMTRSFIIIILQTMGVAVGVAVICIIMALFITLAKRNLPSYTSLKIVQEGAALGYAIPGTVLAIAVLVVLTAFDYILNDILNYFQSESIGLIFSGSVFAIIFAFCIRFCSISINTIDARLKNISNDFDQAAQLLRHNKLSVNLAIHFPLLKHAILAATLLIFIEVIKELPAALILRPFNFELLSTYIFQYISDEMIEHAALGAMLITLLSMVPLLIINKLLHKEV